MRIEEIASDTSTRITAVIASCLSIFKKRTFSSCIVTLLGAILHIRNLQLVASLLAYNQQSRPLASPATLLLVASLLVPFFGADNLSIYFHACVIN
jgi:hypothetical protein